MAKANAELSRGGGEQVGHAGEVDAAPGAGGGVIAVVTPGRSGHHAQTRGLGKQGVVHAVGHEAHQRGGVAQALGQLVAREGAGAG